jgi:hypothetical protein
MRLASVLLCAAALLRVAAAEDFFPVPAEQGAERFGSGIQRAMTLLATSTPAKRNPVRILFYGQSITKQEWSQAVAQDIRTRFPHADLTIENRAIGGYSSEFLIQTVAHDVYGFYPDLIIFHDFGGQENYQKIIAGILRNTTAEILIQTDYPTWRQMPGEPENPARAKREAQHESHSSEWIPKLCEKYGCEVVDVRRPWTEYLEKNNLPASAVLADGVHLNKHGNYLLAEITKRHLKHNPAFAEKNPPTVVTPQWEDGRIKVEFEGNRVELVTGRKNEYHAAEATVLIDGKKPSEIPELYFISRPTDTYAVDWPSVNRVTATKSLLVEDWTLRVLETNAEDSKWRFEVIGSKTGKDGEGVSTERFESKSGRVVIEPGEWGVNRAFRLRRQLTPVGFEVKWSVVPMFTDVYRGPRVADPSREYVTVLASGLPNGKHTLELVAKDKTNPPIREIRIFKPLVK